MWRKIALGLFFPLCSAFGPLVGIERERIERFFIQLNNRFLERNSLEVSSSEILLLIPHCLQNWDCLHKITGSLSNCRRCGSCMVKDLIELSEKYQVSMEMATGGTLARRAVKEHKPSLIVAVACERDLITGIKDCLPLPVWGILNLRPHGPCKNTSVDLAEVERATTRFMKRS